MTVSVSVSVSAFAYSRLARVASITGSIVLLACPAAPAWADTAATVDVGFVGKVSQGGSYEVQAGRLAVGKATAPAVKSFAEKDVADHEAVNAELKTIAAAQGIAIAPTLNHELQGKLDKLGKASGAAFDKAYVAAMTAIHHKDEKIFATEAKASGNADWKAFAAKTDGIVKGHIATLDPMKASMK